MSEALRTAVLIDGSPDPPALRIDETERKPFISQGRAGQTPRNFKFVRAVEVKIPHEEEPRKAYLYRLVNAPMTDDEFEALAAAEVDKHLNPERYAKVTSPPLNADERAELEELRRRAAAK